MPSGFGTVDFVDFEGQWNIQTEMSRSRLGEETRIGGVRAGDVIHRNLAVETGAVISDRGQGVGEEQKT